MLPQIASALARVLNPIKPIERPGTPKTAKSSEGGEGGYGPAGYEGREKPPEAPSEEAQFSAPLPEEGVLPPTGEKLVSGVPFRPGLTQVILDLCGARTERSGGSAAQTYEAGAKEQKKNAKLPKGSMLDKKVG